jgi:predicted nuclease of restriction endonuclease-like (RecB) superfamily
MRKQFSDMKGLSRANLSYMRAFAEAYPNEQIVQQLAGQISWWHNVVIMTKLKDPEIREWYIRACIENGWSRAVLMAQIETRLHERAGRSITNFRRTLPAPQSELAQQILKDPYKTELLPLFGR